MVKGLDATEEEILLVPACYNKKGLLGDFQIAIKDRGILRLDTLYQRFIIISIQ